MLATCEPCIWQCLLGGEATRGVGIGEDMDKALGCGVRCQRLKFR